MLTMEQNQYLFGGICLIISFILMLSVYLVFKYNFNRRPLLKFSLTAITGLWLCFGFYCAYWQANFESNEQYSLKSNQYFKIVKSKGKSFTRDGDLYTIKLQNGQTIKTKNVKLTKQSKSFKPIITVYERKPFSNPDLFERYYVKIEQYEQPPMPALKLKETQN